MVDVITGGAVDVGRGVLGSPSFKVSADDATVLPIARAVTAGSEQAATEAEAAPAPFATLDLHDRIAIRAR